MTVKSCLLSSWCLQGYLAQSATYLTADPYLTAYPGVASSIQVWSHTFVVIDHEIVSTVILLLSHEELLKVASKSMCTKYSLTA